MCVKNFWTLGSHSRGNRMGWTLSITDLILLVSQLVKFGDVGMAYMYQTFGLWVPRLLELGGGRGRPLKFFVWSCYFSLPIATVTEM